jgi:hypothetical protein
MSRHLASRERASRAAADVEVTRDASALERNVNALAERIREARPHAKAGDIFTDDVSQVFRDRIAEVLHTRGRNVVLGEIEDEVAPSAEGRVAINGHFQWAGGSSMPPELLDVLPGASRSTGVSIRESRSRARGR